MLQKIRQLLQEHDTKLRYLFVGGLNTAVGLAIFPILFFALAAYKLHYVVIFVLSQVASITFAYITNKFAVFKTRGNYIREYSRFLTFYVSYAVFNLVVLAILVESTGISPVWLQSLCAVLVVLLSYVWHSRITFKPVGEGRER